MPGLGRRFRIHSAPSTDRSGSFIVGPKPNRLARANGPLHMGAAAQVSLRTFFGFRLARIRVTVAWSRERNANRVYIPIRSPVRNYLVTLGRHSTLAGSVPGFCALNAAVRRGLS